MLGIPNVRFLFCLSFLPARFSFVFKRFVGGFFKLFLATGTPAVDLQTTRTLMPSCLSISKLLQGLGVHTNSKIDADMCTNPLWVACCCVVMSERYPAVLLADSLRRLRVYPLFPWLSIGQHMHLLHCSSPHLPHFGRSGRCG